MEKKKRTVHDSREDLLLRSPKFLDKEVQVWEIPQKLTLSFSQQFYIVQVPQQQWAVLQILTTCQTIHKLENSWYETTQMHCVCPVQAQVKQKSVFQMYLLADSSVLMVPQHFHPHVTGFLAKWFLVLVLKLTTNV